MINIREIVLDIDVKVLMTLSSIANADASYIKGPEPLRKTVAQIQIDSREREFRKDIQAMIE